MLHLGSVTASNDISARCRCFVSFIVRDNRAVYIRIRSNYI